MGADLRGGIGGNIGADLRGLQQRIAGGKPRKHGTHERVAATGGVHRLDLRCRHTMPTAVFNHHGTGCTKRHDGAIKAVIRESFGDFIPVERLHIAVRQPQQLGHFMLIDQQDIGNLHQFMGQLVHERRVVEQHSHTGVMRSLSGGDHGGNRAFQAQSQHRATGDGQSMRLHIARSRLGIGSRRIDDGVLSLGTDGDHRGAAGAFDMQDIGGVNAGLVQFAQQEIRIGIVAHCTQQLDVQAETGCSGRLICTLAAGHHLHGTALDGLARLGQSFSRHCVIGIHRTNHDYRALRILQRFQSFPYGLRHLFMFFFTYHHGLQA